MSRKVDTGERIRDLARQHPGWTPSQIAIFLQGEQLKVTSEDVRRTLARPAAIGAETDATPRRRYAAPREERRASPLPIGSVFGLLLAVLLSTVYGLMPRVATEAAVPALALYVTIAVSVLVLLMTGAAASRLGASGALTGTIAALLGTLISLGVGFLLYELINRERLDEASGAILPALTEPELGSELVIGSGINLLAAALIGLLLGWLGARLFGRKRRRSTLG